MKRHPLVLALLLGATTALLRSSHATDPEEVVRLEQTVKRVIAKVGPSVVRIEVDGTPKDPRPERRFFRDPSVEPREGGAGVVIRKDGLVLTHASLLAFELPRIEVLTGSGRRLAADVIARDEKLDIALLKVDVGDDPLPAVELGTASDLTPGRLVLSFGNPFGVARDARASASLGIVRFVGPIDARESTYAGSVIFTDAAVNPGNEGGPLVDLDGRVLGIVAPLARDQRTQSLSGFAIPIDAIAPGLERLSKGGSAGKIGILVKDDDLVVERVVPDGPAGKAGVLAGDKLVSVDGTKVASREALRSLLEARQRGARVKLSFERAGSPVTVELTLGGAP